MGGGGGVRLQKVLIADLCLIIIIIVLKICSGHISTLLGVQGANPGASPFSFTIGVLVFFTCITQHTGPTALRPIRRTKQLWLSVLLNDTSAVTSHTGIRTHILTTPELESNARDRSATVCFPCISKRLTATYSATSSAHHALKLVLVFDVTSLFWLSNPYCFGYGRWLTMVL